MLLEFESSTIVPGSTPELHSIQHLSHTEQGVLLAELGML